MNRHHPLFFPLILVLYEITLYLSNDMFLPALPIIIRDLHLSESQAQFIVTVWFIGAASLPLLIGAFVDHFGRRPTLLIGGLLYVLTTIACAIAMNFVTMIPARILQGATVPCMTVAGYACIHEIYDQKEAIRILAIMSSISVLAPALGPLVGALLLLVASWRWIFWSIAIGAGAFLTLLYFQMPETLTDENRRPLALKSLLSQYFAILKNPHFILLMLCFGMDFAGFIAWITAGPLLMIEYYQLSTVGYGIAQLIVFMAFILGNHATKYLLETLSPKQLIEYGMMIFITGAISILPIAAWFPSSVTALIIALIVFSFGSGLCFPPLNRLVIESSDQPMGSRMGIFMIALTLSGALGSGLASLFYSGTPLSFALIVAGCSLASVTFHRIWNKMAS